MIKEFEILQDEKYFVISINYEKVNGINVYYDLSKADINNLNLDFYKLYIFNENRMYLFYGNYSYFEYKEKKEENEFYVKEYCLKDNIIAINSKGEKEIFDKIRVNYYINNDEEISYFGGLVK
ncbi:hypothetical protein [Streptobacillus canis]|uniref:hypothetical protein n=1 Tax=Streptobacillus canis TaxID=2678686 RepID=UPI0012E10A12|nr:hypothetical protein [Streptobacillus canis]